MYGKTPGHHCWWLTKDGVSLANFDDESQVDEIIKLQAEREKRDIEQQIKGMEMVVETFATQTDLHFEFEVTPDQIYDLCDEIYGGDSQHIRGQQ